MTTRVAAPFTDLGTLGAYRRYEATPGHPPDVVIEIVEVDRIELAPGPLPTYPALRRKHVAGALLVERRDLAGEIQLSLRNEAPVRGCFRMLGCTPQTIEAAIRVTLSTALPYHGCLILHASAIEHGGMGSLFLGKSGAGKSTISSMLASGYGHLTKLADELLLVRKNTHGVWEVHVGPFLGRAELPHGQTAVCESINFLEQADRCVRDRLRPSDSLRELLRHVVAYVADGATADRVLATATDFTSSVPSYRFRFNKHAASVASLLRVT